MAVQGSVDTVPTHSVARTTQTTARNSKTARSWVISENRPLVVLVLIFSEVLLALALWQVALMLQGVWGHGALTPFALATVVPNVGVWVALRSLLGLYPGYGLGQVEELRHQVFALFTTLT